MASEKEFDSYRVLMEFLLKAKQRIIAIGSESGLTSMQTLTLVLSKPGSPEPMNNLCATFCCDASNVTGIVDGLEQKQLVSRQSHPKDRRVKVVQIEPEGVKVRNQVMQRLTDKESFLFANLTKAETEQFIALVQKIALPGSN